MRLAATEIKVNLSEIFTSIEGEGILFGTKTMFVRLAGCPLKCHWCDTTYALSFDSGTQYGLDEVKAMISTSLLRLVTICQGSAIYRYLQNRVQDERLGRC